MGSVCTCLFQPGQPQTRTLQRAACCWGQEKGWEMPFLFPWREFGPSTLTWWEAERTTVIFHFTPLWLSMASSSAVRRSDGISSCKVAASCFKSPAYCTIHHSFFGSTMAWELHKIGCGTIKIDQNALVDTENQSLKLRDHSSSFPSCLPMWWCAWLPLMSSDYWSLTFCTHISSFTWAYITSFTWAL